MKESVLLSVAHAADLGQLPRTSRLNMNLWLRLSYLKRVHACTYYNKIKLLRANGWQCASWSGLHKERSCEGKHGTSAVSWSFDRVSPFTTAHTILPGMNWLALYDCTIHPSSRFPQSLHYHDLNYTLTSRKGEQSYITSWSIVRVICYQEE